MAKFLPFPAESRDSVAHEMCLICRPGGGCCSCYGCLSLVFEYFSARLQEMK